jgi:PAS domain-containing protein
MMQTVAQGARVADDEHRVEAMARALAAVDSLPTVAALVFDRELRYEAAHGGALVLYGFGRPEDLIGRRAAEVVPPAAWVRIEALLRKALGGELVHVEVPGSDGVVRYVATYQPVRRGDEVVGVSVGIVDVTEERRVRAELEAQVELFEQSFDGAPIGKALLTADGHWLRLNPALSGSSGAARRSCGG